MPQHQEDHVLSVRIEPALKLPKYKQYYENQFGLEYIYTWKCHKEVPYIAILNKNTFFFKNRQQGSKTGLVWGLVSVRGVRI
jgi:hypothetical protein